MIGGLGPPQLQASHVCFWRILPPPPSAPSRTGDGPAWGSLLPPPPPPSTPSLEIASFIGIQWISKAASDSRLRVKKLTSDSCREHFLLLQFFDTLPGCRFTDCQFSVSGASHFHEARTFGWVNQAVPERELVLQIS